MMKSKFPTSRTLLLRTGDGQPGVTSTFGLHPPTCIPSLLLPHQLYLRLLSPASPFKMVSGFNSVYPASVVMWLLGVLLQDGQENYIFTKDL